MESTDSRNQTAQELKVMREALAAFFGSLALAASDTEVALAAGIARNDLHGIDRERTAA